MPPSVLIKQIDVAKGKTTQLRYIQASKEVANNAILILPALGVPASYYDRLLKSLAQKGCSAAVIDFQGQGNSSVIASRKNNSGYYQLLTEDIPGAITEVSTLFNANVDLLGHSLGGQVGSLYCATHDSRVKRLILCTCCSVYYRSWKGFNRLRVLAFSQFARGLAKVLGYFPGKKVGFGDRTFERLIGDWGRQALTGKYQIKGSKTDWEAALKTITIPVFSIHLKYDFLAPPEAVEHLCNKLPSDKVTLCCVDEPKLNHFNWLRSPAIFIAEITKWLDHTKV
jgi:predicted alpha/beta hydrolase